MEKGTYDGTFVRFRAAEFKPGNARKDWMPPNGKKLTDWEYGVVQKHPRQKHGWQAKMFNDGMVFTIKVKDIKARIVAELPEEEQKAYAAM